MRHAEELWPPAGPLSVVLIIDRVEPGDGPGLCERLRQALADNQVDAVTCDLSRVTIRDLAVVDGLARMQLAARRRGAYIRIRAAADDVVRLLTLAGLGDVVRRTSGSAVGVLR